MGLLGWEGPRRFNSAIAMDLGSDPQLLASEVDCLGSVAGMLLHYQAANLPESFW